MLLFNLIICHFSKKDPSESFIYYISPSFSSYIYIFILPFFSPLQHGACVNAMDLWQFTPLHEAASKNRVEVCSLLLSHGADPTLLNCHSKSSVDMAPTPELKERLTCESVFTRTTADPWWPAGQPASKVEQQQQKQLSLIFPFCPLLKWSKSDSCFRSQKKIFCIGKKKVFI